MGMPIGRPLQEDHNIEERALEYRRYSSDYRSDCLSLFDANCPAFFAPNERSDYSLFLDGEPSSYTVAIRSAAVEAAFGLPVNNGIARLSWIMVSPASHGSGIGSAIMSEAKARAQAQQATAIHIAASHLSAPFFQRFGAREVGYAEDGWGPRMHRIDMVLSLERS